MIICGPPGSPAGRPDAHRWARKCPIARILFRRDHRIDQFSTVCAHMAMCGLSDGTQGGRANYGADSSEWLIKRRVMR